MKALRSMAAHRPASHEAASTDVPLPGWAHWATAVAVALGLVTAGEAVPQGGTILLAMYWLILLLAVSVRYHLARRTMRWDYWDGCVLAFMGWIIVDAYRAGLQSNARWAWNACWTWVAMLASYLILRRLATSDAVRRAMVAGAIALATANAAHGLYQYFVSMPAERARYARANVQERRQILREAGLNVEPDSPAAKLFEDRLQSKEPYAAFGLANSLAGLLAPWCVVALGLAIVSGASCPLAARAASVLAAGVCLICLVFTKSRSAWIATAVALALLCVAPTGWPEKSGWRRLVLVLAMTALISLAVAGALWSGAIDRQVLTEAALSLRYRIQYWQAALAMLADHPWWGCGPGNFQIFYVQYKAAEASETVADPHQFLLEVAATLGIPGLLLFVSVTAAAVWQGCKAALRSVESLASRASAVATSYAESHSRNQLRMARRWYVGGLLAILLAPAYGWIVDLPSERDPWLSLPVLWLIGLPVASLVLAGLDRWVVDGKDIPRLWLLAWLALAINLSAAGGISYPNVAQSWWVLAALASPVRTLVGPASRDSAVPRTWRLAPFVTAYLAGITVLAAMTGYLPVVEGTRLLQQAATAASVQEALANLQRSAAADPWNSEPWRWLTQLYFEQWAAVPNVQTKQAWYECLEQARRRNPLSYPLAEWEGQLALRAYALRREQSDLERAMAAFQRATRLYPNSAFAHAQLAWTMYLAGQPARAAQHAARALELDRRNPHVEQKLAARRLPETSLAADLQIVLPDKANAEQWMEYLRSSGTQNSLEGEQ